MASEIMMPSFSKEKQFKDHLFENKILDSDEPQYENGDILRELVLQNSNFHINQDLENSVTTIFVPDSDKGKEENIYENIGFIQECLNSITEEEFEHPSITEPNEPNLESQNSGLYRSTLLFTIGKDDKSNEIEKPVQSLTNNDISKVEEDLNLEKSDEGSFKSSYAKSLIDSYRKNSSSPNQTSPSGPLSRTSSPSSNCDITFKCFDSVNAEPIQNNVFQPVFTEKVPDKSPCSLPGLQFNFQDDSCMSKRTSSHYINKISDLSEDLKQKDKELDLLRRELSSLQLDYSRLKTENRSLKMNQSFSQRSFSIGESQLSSFTSLSADSDTWTLQQQIISLKSQLEKAELSRHAYESATKQLVHFLETINSTLTVSQTIKPDVSPIVHPLNATELITNLENTLANNRIRSTPKVKPWFDSNRNGSYLSDVDVNNRRRRRRSIDPLCSSSASSSNGSKKSSSVNKEKKSRHLQSSSTGKGKGDNKMKKDTSSDNTSSLSKHKKTLLRSGSVNDISSNHVTPLPRVTRAVSTHCVAINQVEDLTPLQSTPSASNRMLATKAKSFFSSLKNIFKPEPSITAIGDRPSSEFKKKMTLPLKGRSVSNSIKKSQSLKRENGRIHSDSGLETHPNSIFYVPCLPPAGEMQILHDPSPSCGSSGDSTTGSDSLSDSSPPQESCREEISGPQELSIALSIQDSGRAPGVGVSGDGYENPTNSTPETFNPVTPSSPSKNSPKNSLTSHSQPLKISSCVVGLRLHSPIHNDSPLKTSKSPLREAIKPNTDLSGSLSKSYTCLTKGSSALSNSSGIQSKSPGSSSKNSNFLISNPNAYTEFPNSLSQITLTNSLPVNGVNVRVDFSSVKNCQSVGVNTTRSFRANSGGRLSGVKRVLWKLSRSSFREPGCRLEFV